MNNCINLSQLIGRLSAVSGTDTNTCRLFLREFFATIADGLADGESVEIKNFGVFRRCTDPAAGVPGDVYFVPDSKMAAEINKAFAEYTPVELADGFDPDSVEFNPPELREEEPQSDSAQESEAVSARESEPVTAPEITVVSEPEVSDETELVIDTVSESDAVTVSEPVYEVVSDPEPVTVSEPDPVESISSEPVAVKASYPEENDENYDDETVIEPPEPAKQRSWLWIVVASIVVGCAVGLFFALTIDVEPDSGYDTPVVQDTIPLPADTRMSDTPTSETPAESVAADGQPVQPAAGTAAQTQAPAREDVYETISGTNYLSVIARRHYQKDFYWVFIYDANRDVIGSNPNQIRPGTRVRVPDVSELPGNSTEERNAIAHQRLNELNRR